MRKKIRHESTLHAHSLVHVGPEEIVPRKLELLDKVDRIQELPRLTRSDNIGAITEKRSLMERGSTRRAKIQRLKDEFVFDGAR